MKFLSIIVLSILLVAANSEPRKQLRSRRERRELGCGGKDGGKGGGKDGGKGYSSDGGKDGGKGGGKGYSHDGGKGDGKGGKGGYRRLPYYDDYDSYDESSDDHDSYDDYGKGDGKGYSHDGKGGGKGYSHDGKGGGKGYSHDGKGGGKGYSHDGKGGDDHYYDDCSESYDPPSRPYPDSESSSSSEDGGVGGSGGPPGCEICSQDNKVDLTELTLTYNADARNSEFQTADKASCREDVFYEYQPSTKLTVEGEDYFITSGETFVITASGSKFPANTEFIFNDNEFECTIHLSCSQPLVRGDQIGPFIIGDNGGRCGTPTTPPPTGRPTMPPTPFPVPAPTPFPVPAPTPFPVPAPTPPPVDPPTGGLSPSGPPVTFAPRPSSPPPTPMPSGAPSDSPTDPPLGSLCGSVTEDVNGDSNGDIPISSVLITLEAPDGTVIAATATGADGGYCFEDLTQGCYVVVETNPPGFADVSDIAPEDGPNTIKACIGGEDPLDSVGNDFVDIRPSDSPSGSPSSSPTDPPLGSICGDVTEDVNGDTNGDIPIVNVMIELKSEDGTILAATVTGADGGYCFENLDQDCYVVMETNPPSFEDVSDIAPEDGPNTIKACIGGEDPLDSVGNDFVDFRPSDSPSTSPSAGPSSAPSAPPSIAPCISVISNGGELNCGDALTVNFNLNDSSEGPLIDDRIGIYHCSEDIFMYPEVWEWTCGNGDDCTEALVQGSITIDSLPMHNNYGPHTWPVAPYLELDGTTVNRCFKAVYFRNDGPSVPPYIEVCESEEFIINETSEAGCAVRARPPPAALNDSN